MAHKSAGDLNKDEMDALIGAALNYTALVAASTITLGQGSQGRLHGYTNVQLIALIARWDAAQQPT